MWKRITFGVMWSVVLSTNLSLAAVDHSVWDTLLKRYVDADGRVAYQDLKTKDLAAFEGYLKTLAETSVDGMSEDEEKAFWINAYNALIVSGVLEGNTAEGFIARKQFFSWYTLKVAGQDRSADDIEHKILRVKFNDPRIHFTIVCASGSCPELRQEAYVAAQLDAQLTDATRRFINDPSRNQITAQQLAISKIFEWFAEDFVKRAGSVPDFLIGFVDAEKQQILKNKQHELDYLEYNWTLNAQDGQRVS
jgi:hypothetical protein